MAGVAGMIRRDSYVSKISRRTVMQVGALAGLGGLAMLPGASPSLAAPPAGTGLFGRAIDLATLQPVADVLVQAEPSGARAQTDQNGAYTLPLSPGRYTIRASRPNYLEVIYPRQTVRSAGYTPLDLNLVPSHPDPAEQEALYARLVVQIQSPPQRLEAAPRALQPLAVTLPSQIQVYYDQANPPYSIWVPLEDYVKGVVPNEMPASWPPAALQAQAVAARTYGVYKQLTRGFVYPDTRDQVYSNVQYSSTNAAVDATAGQVMTANGQIICAFFFSRCNGQTTRNSEQAILYNGTDAQGAYICSTGSFGVLSYCRARCCTWNAASTRSECGYYGHGVGMCQWGSYGQASAGRPYATILNSYYTGVAITTGSLSTNATGTSTPAGPYTIYLPYVTNTTCS